MTCDLLQKIELIHAAGTQFVPPNARDVVRTFYDLLTILDNKGLALLAFDGIIVAATTFAAEKKVVPFIGAEWRVGLQFL